MEMLQILFILALLIWIFYKTWVSPYKTWSQRGIPEEPGVFPFGSNADYSLMRKFQGNILDEAYRKHCESPYFGIYMVRIPLLVIRDPEIIRLVLAKEFSHFRDRKGYHVADKDFLNQHLFNLEGERWRALRVRLSPTFTSGKMKGMFPLFVKCAETLDAYLYSKLDNEVDIKEIAARFTTDIICSCAFGLDVKCIGDSDNEFRKMGQCLLEPSINALIRVVLLRTFPAVFDFLQLRTSQKKNEDFLLKIVTDTVQRRKQTGENRNDFMDLLIQLKDKGVVGEHLVDDENQNIVKPVEITYEVMAAQCFVFFVAGFETSSSVQSYCFYELALQPEIQERLRKEIDTVLEKHGGLTYQAVLEMQYLDMVVSETMRKYPTLYSLKRRCTKNFVSPAGHIIREGDLIIIPTWSLHRDPSYFPKPESFNPERFSPENKEFIKPFTYLPFGEGPRLCIGNRFGLLQTKVGIITLLRNYKVEPSEKTVVPLEFIPSFEITTVKNKIFLQLKKRAPA